MTKKPWQQPTITSKFAVSMSKENMNCAGCGDRMVFPSDENPRVCGNCHGTDDDPNFYSDPDPQPRGYLGRERELEQRLTDLIEQIREVWGGMMTIDDPYQHICDLSDRIGTILDKAEQDTKG